MRQSRLFTEQPLQAGGRAELQGQSAHYLAHVLRLGAGDRVWLFNGDGADYDAEVSRIGKHDVQLQVGAVRTVATESPLHTVLGLGISRGERMDFAIQKSTELGVSVIAPLFTERCEVKLQGERSDKRSAHWRQVAISACEQCGRARIPLLLPPTALDLWLGAAPGERRFVLDHEEQGTLGGSRPGGGVCLLIGPEGGLAPAEIAAAKAAGFSGLALGPRVLRTETAPLAVLAVLQYLWGK